MTSDEQFDFLRHQQEMILTELVKIRQDLYNKIKVARVEIADTRTMNVKLVMITDIIETPNGCIVRGQI